MASSRARRRRRRVAATAAPARESATRRCVPPRLHKRSGPAPTRRTTAFRLFLYLDLQLCMMMYYPQFGYWTTLTANEAMHAVSGSRSSFTITVHGIRHLRAATHYRICFTDINQSCCGHAYRDHRRQGSSRDHIDDDFHLSVNLACSRYRRSELYYLRPMNESKWYGHSTISRTSLASSIRPAA